MNKLIESIADLLSDVKCYNLESVCNEYGLIESEKQLDPCASKNKYVLSRLNTDNKEFLLNLATQLLDRGGASFARSIDNYFPEGIFKLSSTTRSNLLKEIVTLGENVNLRPTVEDIWEVNYFDPLSLLAPKEVENIPFENLLFNKIDFMYVSDESIFKLLELATHPRICDDSSQEVFVNSFNKIISADGFQLRQDGFNSTRPFYKVSELHSSITGSVKNLIFAADGLKPELILSDSLNNDVKIVKNEDNCLIYEDPIPKTGLAWDDLVTWWQKSKYCKSECDHEKELYKRLYQSLDSKPEQLFFYTYFKVFRDRYKKLPALIPQVYLHYDPYTAKKLNGEKRLARQRMDFLLLLPSNNRVVIEIDGKQHYSTGDTSSPKLYSDMVSEDRELKLKGYNIFRFGGYELSSGNATILIENFIERLFDDIYALEESVDLTLE